MSNDYGWWHHISLVARWFPPLWTCRASVSQWVYRRWLCHQSLNSEWHDAEIIAFSGVEAEFNVKRSKYILLSPIKNNIITYNNFKRKSSLVQNKSAKVAGWVNQSWPGWLTPQKHIYGRGKVKSIERELSAICSKCVSHSRHHDGHAQYSRQRFWENKISTWKQEPSRIW